MGLTSGLFISLIMIAAVGSLAATVWLWPRVAGRRIRDLGARLGLLVVCQALVVAAFLAFLNGYFSFFGSWPELVGSGASLPAQVAAPGLHAKPLVVTATDLGPMLGGSVLPVQADGALASKPPGAPGASAGPHPPGSPHSSAGPQPVAGLNPGAGLGSADGQVSRARPRRSGWPRRGRLGVTRGGRPRNAAAINGEVLQIAINGQRSGIAVVRDYLYLPPQYFQRAYAKARFPVVLALTGYPNEPWSIVKRLALPATAARLVAAKRIKPAIYLMMNVSPALPRDTECTNVPAGPQVLSFFSTDVPLAMEQAFRVQTGRAGWATLGYSTGGYCATKLAMLDSGQYSAAVSMAGYYNAIQDQTTGDLYGGSTAYQNENDLFWRLTHLPAPPVSVLVTSSRVGERSLPGTLAFLRLIRPPMRGYSLIVPQGGHNYGTWNRELPQSLEWLNRRLTPAVPQPELAVQRS
jgi:enterochelin esterase-like enzyme